VLLELLRSERRHDRLTALNALEMLFQKFIRRLVRTAREDIDEEIRRTASQVLRQWAPEAADQAGLVVP